MESAQSIAYAAVDTILVQRNWLLGKRIAIECLNENGKADYGKKTVKKYSVAKSERTMLAPVPLLHTILVPLVMFPE